MSVTYSVLRPEQLTSYERGGGARTVPLVQRSTGATSFINGITEFSPGAAIAFHSHNCVESVVMLEGHAFLDIAGETHELNPLDTTLISPNVPHRFRNRSATESMKILWIYATPDATRTLIESGETRLVAAEHNA